MTYVLGAKYFLNFSISLGWSVMNKWSGFLLVIESPVRRKIISHWAIWYFSWITWRMFMLNGRWRFIFRRLLSSLMIMTWRIIVILVFFLIPSAILWSAISSVVPVAIFWTFFVLFGRSRIHWQHHHWKQQHNENLLHIWNLTSFLHLRALFNYWMSKLNHRTSMNWTTMRLQFDE